MRVLAKILALITFCDRQLVEPSVDFEWHPYLLTYNCFRLWETVFGRRSGVRLESEVQCDTEGNTTVKFHTWESVLVHFEELVRAWKPFPYKVYVPKLAGGNFFAPSPYLFAVAYDTSTRSTTGTTSPRTWSHTVTGSNTYMYAAGLYEANAASDMTAMTYNAADMGTALGTTAFVAGSAGVETYWDLINPATGANNVTLSFSSGGAHVGWSMSFSGAAQSGQPDGSSWNGENSASTASYTMNVTVTAANSLLAAILFGAAGNAITAGTNTTVGFDSVGTGEGATVYSSSAQSAGAKTMNVTSTAQVFQSGTISIAPVASGPANVKTWNGLAIASIKTFNGLATGSTKTVNGLG